MCYTLYFKAKGSSFSATNVKEWLKSVTLISDKKGETIHYDMEKTSVISLLKEIKGFLTDVIVDSTTWVNVLEDMYRIFLHENVDINAKVQSLSMAAMNSVIGAGSNNIDLKDCSSLKIASMKYWVNKINPEDERIYVNVKNGSNEYTYYIHKNHNRYPKKEFVNELNGYHLGGMLQQELSFCGCKSIDEMFATKGNWGK